MDAQVNPFAALSLIVAPAILTNAASLLAMSTSNRLARAVDRARELSKELEEPGERKETGHVLHELAVTEQRSLLLLRALRSIYWALGSFAFATLLSLVGALLAPAGANVLFELLEAIALVGGISAVGALVYGSTVLVHETRLVVQVLQDRAAHVRALAAPSDPART